MQVDGFICRVCLNPLKQFFLQENTDIQIRNLQFCVPQLDLTATTDFFLCHTCQDSLKNLYDFKINCLQTEEKLKSHLKSNLLEKNDIKRALTSISNSESLDGFHICRTCLQSTENVCHINKTYLEVIVACVPEPDPAFFVNTIICRPCETKFKRMLLFRNQCFFSEELINEFKKTANKDKINLTDLIKWKQKTVSIKKEVDNGINYEINQSDYVSFNSNNQPKDIENIFIKNEPEVHIKQEFIDIMVEDIQEDIKDIMNIDKEVDNDINYKLVQSDCVSLNINNQPKDIESLYNRKEAEVHIKHECVDIGVEDIQEKIIDTVSIKKEVDNDIKYEMDQPDYVSLSDINNQPKDIESVYIKNEQGVYIKHECLDIKVEDIVVKIEAKNHSSYVTSLPLSPASKKQKKAKAAAERQRAYYYRKKQKKLAENPRKESKTDQEIREKKIEYLRKYRLAKKMAKLLTSHDGDSQKV